MSSEPETAQTPQTASVFGTCACGKYSVRAEGEVLFRTACHCTICSPLAGAPYVMVLGFAHKSAVVPALTETFTARGRSAEFTPEDVAAVLDELHVYPSSEAVLRYSCPVCTSAICNISLLPPDSPPGPFGEVPLAILERDANSRIIGYDDLAPTAHMFYSSRILDVNDDLPKFSTYPGSDLVQ